MSWATLLDLLEAWRGRGDRIALVFRADVRRFRWSYARLALGVERVASYLLEQGVRGGDRVLLWAPNGDAWVLAFFGCLRAGLVPVPLDPRSPPGFVRAVQAQTDACLAVRSRLRPAPDLPCPSVLAEDLDVVVDEPRPTPPLPEITPDTPAEIVYTSGTTGTPKGVLLTHRNLTANLASVHRVLPSVPDLSLLSLLPLSHTFGQQIGLLLPMARGGRTVLIETLKPAAVTDAIAEESVLALVAVPRLLELLLDHLTRQVARVPSGGALFAMAARAAERLSMERRRLLFWPLHRHLGGRLRYLVSGGAALEPRLELAWERLGFLVLQGYGLTEAAPVVACNTLTAHRVGSVGRPVPGVAVRIAPDGEVLVQGPNVTPGYYRAPEATRAAFEDGWLRTGDLGHFDEDGFLFIDGRKKEAIVTPAGVTVFPEDVEGALNQQPGVRESVVVWWRGRITAVLLPTDPRTFDPRRAVEGANRLLAPSQQVQDALVWPFPDFPRTPLLKASRRAVLETLPAVTAGRPSAPPPGVRLPATTVRQVVAQVAGVPLDRLSPDATLGLDLGLGSVERLDLVARLEHELGVEVDEEAITGRTRVQDLERLVEEGALPHRRLRLRRWTRWRPVGLLRQAFWNLALFPLVRLVCRPLHIEGREHLDALRGPVLFAANHTSYLDVPVILLALPPHLRNRTAVAAWAEFFEPTPEQPLLWLPKRLAYEFVTIFFNAFLVPHRRGFRTSLRYAGELVDHGWSLLFFPEGAMTRTGRMNPFREGLGLFVAHLKVPVVPIRVEGLFEILYPHSARLRPGPAAVRIGRPLMALRGSYIDITKRVEDAVRGL